MSIICLLLALLCFVLAAFGIKFDDVEIVPIGLAFLAAAGIVGDGRMPWNKQ